MTVQEGEPLPGTVNQQEFFLWDQPQRDARKAGEEYEPPADMSAEAEKKSGKADDKDKAAKK
jgi:hypothetical protein